jgi:hypothetical protein
MISKNIKTAKISNIIITTINITIYQLYIFFTGTYIVHVVGGQTYGHLFSCDYDIFLNPLKEKFKMTWNQKQSESFIVNIIQYIKYNSNYYFRSTPWFKVAMAALVHSRSFLWLHKLYCSVVSTHHQMFLVQRSWTTWVQFCCCS